MNVTGLFVIVIATTVTPAPPPPAAVASTTLLEAKAFPLRGPDAGLEPEILDFRYAPLHWQTCIGLPLDPYKSMVGSDGGLYYEFGKGPYKGRYYGVSTGKYFGFHLRVLAALQAEGQAGRITQTLLSPRVPVVITEQRSGDLLLRQEAWAAAPQGTEVAEWGPRRLDYLWLKLKNVGSRPANGAIILRIDGRQLVLDKKQTRLVEADHSDKVFAAISSSLPGPPRFMQSHDKNDQKSACLVFPAKPDKGEELAPGEEFRVLVALYQGPQAASQIEEKDAAAEQQRAVKYWTEQTGLPYDRITVPDQAMQQLLDSCIRNIYQAREIRDGRPLFQVGPTLYRGTWAADGAFIMETVAYLGRADEARIGLENQVERDQGPQGVTFSKQLGLRLWMIWRHAQLTGDWQWLQRMWPCVQRNAKQIVAFRQMTRSDPEALNFGLMPPGTGDGGLGGVHLEYTNVYWTLAGLRAAIEMAEKIHQPEAAAWKAEYQDYWNCFERARRRDQVTDGAGNLYLPVVMKGQAPQAPQRGAWAFLQSVFPGRIFAADDPLMAGTLAMLDANQREGLIYGTGWIADGIWNYAGSFYAHAHLWQGHGRKAAATLYAFANHACPLLCWREEQNCKGERENYIGDMPHNWASAELIRLVRHLVILERGNELHLLESLPRTWTKPGSQTRLVQVPTSFGPMDLTLTVAPAGKTARLEVQPPRRDPPETIAVHLEQFGRAVRVARLGEQDVAGRPLQVPADKPFVLTLELAD